MTIYTPIDLPKLEPDSWETFWQIWNLHADSLVKQKMNVDTSDADIGSSSVWRGLDIYKLSIGTTAWEAPYYDISKELPKLHATIRQLQLSGLIVYRVRLISSTIDVKSHTDDNLDRWAYRSYFHYTSTKPQWYFTKKNDADGERHYMSLPPDMHWFAYNDGACWHGSIYDPDHPKILAQLYVANQTVATKLAQDNIKKYKIHTIEL